MCANCVSKFDVVVGTIGFGSYLLRGPVKSGLVELGILPEPHPLAVEIRTVAFLRDLDLDPAPILGEEVVGAVDAARGWKPAKVYRRPRLSTVFGSMRSQRVAATR
jgi:hypothetical protein